MERWQLAACLVLAVLAGALPSRRRRRCSQPQLQAAAAGQAFASDGCGNGFVRSVKTASGYTELLSSCPAVAGCPMPLPRSNCPPLSRHPPAPWQARQRRRSTPMCPSGISSPRCTLVAVCATASSSTAAPTARETRAVGGAPAVACGVQAGGWHSTGRESGWSCRFITCCHVTVQSPASHWLLDSCCRLPGGTLLQDLGVSLAQLLALFRLAAFAACLTWLCVHTVGCQQPWHDLGS